MGDRGRLQTSQLQRMAPNHGDVRFTIESIPSLVRLDRAFAIGARIINNWCVDIQVLLNMRHDFSITGSTRIIHNLILHLIQRTDTRTGTELGEP